jgi:hypothetical protein
MLCLLICGSATRSPCQSMMPSAQIGVETRNGIAYLRLQTLGWVGMVCLRPSLQTSADGGRTSLVQTTRDDPTERSESRLPYLCAQLMAARTLFQGT